MTQFIARRGHPWTNWSDNGTNFVGANNELKQLASLRQTSDFQDNLLQKKIVWKLNPAAVQHSGGTWVLDGEDLQTSLQHCPKWTTPYR